jgi:signal transduction histidine kinase
MRSRSRFVLSFLPAVVLGAGIVLLGAAELWHSHEQARRRGEETARTLVRVLAEQTERTLQAIDFTLSGIGDAVAAQNPPANDPRFRETLNERLKALPYVRALFVVGPDGLILHDTDHPSAPGVSVADRPYFEAHRDDPNLGLRIGHPLRSRSVDTWFVSVTRSVERADGGFGGVVVAALEPRYFEAFYRGLSVGANGFIALLLRDGTLLARSPASEEAIGKSFATASPVYTNLADSHLGVYWGTSPVDGTLRVVGYQALEASPVVVLVGLARKSVFESWGTHAAMVLGTSAVLLALLAILVYLLMRNRNRERVELERLNRAQRLEALGRIAGGIAHDFGNTIRIIQSTCLLLKPSLAGDPGAQSLVGDTERFLASTKQMTERLLAFARRQDLRPQVTLVDERIEGFASILRQAAGPRVWIDLKLGSDRAACLLDPVQFEATLLNLVLNARDAMPYGGTIRVETRLVLPPRGRGILRRAPRGGGRWVQISVEDTGVGMSRNVQEQAFDPFFTTKGPGQGSGLGLSQVLGFVQQSEGEMELESEEGRGTTVRLMFTAVPSPDAADRAPDLRLRAEELLDRASRPS